MEGFTVEKSQRLRGYLGHPEMLEGYLWWYLPLNLLKLSGLLPGLPGPIPAQITDYGCGPWTLPLAAWLLYPDWRRAPLGWTLVEPQAAALRAGRKIFEVIAAADPHTEWKFTQIPERLGTAIRRKADLVVSSHALNEWSESEEAVARFLLRDAQPQARILVVEPGTRLAVRRLVQLRAHLIASEAWPLAPCPHSGNCPAPGRTSSDRFCHFPAPADLPAWMRDLARELGTEKQSNTLSYLYVQRGLPRPHPPSLARIISGEIPLNDGVGCYLCSREGLLVGGAGQAAWGDLVVYRKDQKVDPKTHCPRVTIHPR